MIASPVSTSTPPVTPPLEAGDDLVASASPASAPLAPWTWPARTLLLAATPIGCLEDATPRLKAALAEADIIAAEDTRRAGLLRSHLGVTRGARLISCHEHNERERAEELLAAVEAGQRVVLISDAGMPTVSDPGFALAREAIARGINVSVLPGPSAPLAALAISGLPSDRFCFEGFLPRKAAALASYLESLAAEKRTLIFFESPRRLVATLEALAEHFGPERQACVCRELTKVHEDAWRGSLAQILARARAGEVRGEIVIVVAGRGDEPSQLNLEEAAAAARELAQREGIKPKAAAKQIAAGCAYSAREIYDALQAAR